MGIPLNEKRSPSGRRRWLVTMFLLLASAASLATSIGLYSGVDLRGYFSPDRVASRRFHRFRKQYRRQVDAMLDVTIGRIRSLGGKCENRSKWHTQYDIDLTEWEGSDLDVAMLSTFSLFAFDNVLNSPDRFWTLKLPATTSDAAFAHLAGAKALATLSAVDARITDAGLAYLSNTNILVLDISGTPITDAGVAHLADAGIHSIVLAGTPITDGCVECLSQGTLPQYVDVSNTALSAAGMVAVARRRSVRFADSIVHGDSLFINSKAARERLPEFMLAHQFHSIDLSCTHITDANLACLAGQQELQSLDLRDSRITGSGLKPLAELPELDSLNLEGLSLTNEGFEALARLHSLRWLFLQGTNVSDPQLVHLQSLSQLEKLDLDHTAITDEGLAHLAKMKSLVSLDLSQTKIVGMQLEHLKQLTALRHLDLSDTDVTDAGLFQLDGFPSLRSLRLYGTPVTISAAREWHRKMPAVTVYHFGEFLKAQTQDEPPLNATE